MSSQNPEPFVAPRWLLCACCVCGMLLAAVCAILPIAVGVKHNYPALLFALILFTFCLHTLVTGSCPDSPIDRIAGAILRFCRR